VVPLLAVAALLTACGGHEAGESDPAAERLPVLNGEPSGPEDDHVVYLISTGERVIRRCSGTLVAPNLVLTARHCISNFMEGTFTCTPEGELAAGSVGGGIGDLVPAENIHVHIGVDPDDAGEPAAVGAEAFVVQTTSICRNDIALVLLDRSLPNLPVAALRLDAGNEKGEPLRAVGYGLDHESVIGVRNTLDGLRIDQVGESEFQPEGDPVPPRTFSTRGPALCLGDSGGPVFADTGAQTGILSQVVGPCEAATARNVFTQVAPFARALIEPAFEAAGAEPIREMGSGATGAGGEGGAGTGGTGAGGGSSGGASPEGGSPAGGAGGLETGGGGAAGDETPGRRGLRKKGGCRCDLVGGVREETELFGLPLVMLLGLLARRRRLAHP
jgi:hypothetical protein